MSAAAIQAFRSAEPPWAAAVATTALLPAVTQAAELVVHWMARTPELGSSLAASLLLSALSTLFSLFAMRRGAFIVGGESCSLGQDLSHLPRLLCDFALVPPRALAGTLGRAGRGAPASR